MYIPAEFAIVQLSIDKRKSGKIVKYGHSQIYSRENRWTTASYMHSNMSESQKHNIE